MDNSGYSQKVNDVIQGDDFELLESDPTKKFPSDIKVCIQQSSYIFPDHNVSRSSLVPMNPQAPILYGLPKIHKEHVPIRPVVSYIGAPAYFLAQKLNFLLLEKSEFKPNYRLKNSLDLITKIKDIRIPPKSMLLSLDVDSLFNKYDIIICWTGTKRQLDVFLNKINEIYGKFIFKLELEQDCVLNFLDLTITRKESLHEFQIYRKPTHTDTVIMSSVAT
ncbi:unnamed protein product [Parnassius mnemosyne]|uniref:Uncharacterized protein n=1 Tax=Parnassius mnemosyne TaxID=213953 RepID=A0AAV1LSY8_9NEOP